MNRQLFYTVLFFMLPLIYFFSLPIETGDLAVWVAQGNVWMSTGKILRHDIFSILPTLDLVYPVGTGILYAWIYKTYDLVGVSIIHKICLFTILGIWFINLKKIKNFNWDRNLILSVLISLFGASVFFTDRPALVAMLPFVLVFGVLQKQDELDKSDYFKLILLNIFWVNIHGSWPLLFVMFIYRQFIRYFLMKKKDLLKTILMFLALSLTTLINPFGSKIFNYVYETIVVSRSRQIYEWIPSLPRGPFYAQVWAFYLLSAISLYLLIKSLKHSKNNLIITLSSPYWILLMMGFQSIRNTALAFFIFPIFLTRNNFLIFKKNNQFDKESKILNGVIVLFTTLLLIVFLPNIKPYSAKFLPYSKRSIFTYNTPVKFAEYLNKTVDNYPVFNEWELGSYLTLKQKHPIFIDSRNIIFSEKEFAQYNDIISAKYSWEILLNQYNVRYVLIEKTTNKFLYSEILKNNNWKNVLEDDYLILFKKAE